MSGFVLCAVCCISASKSIPVRRSNASLTSHYLQSLIYLYEQLLANGDIKVGTDHQMNCLIIKLKSQLHN